MDEGFVLRGASAKDLPALKVKIFPQDPLVAERSGGLGVAEIELPGEACLGLGPTSARVAVVDYNGDLDEVLQPVEVLASGNGFRVGGGRHADNHRFRQVNVWAVITRTLNLLESELVFGRRIPWAFGRGRLLVLPHAGYWENAYYDRSTGALHFFYFEGRRGERVYTCLSHDIVTHELGHAVLDGLKPYYNELGSPATAGFHEYFGDAVALASAMSHDRLMVELVGRAEPDLGASNFINDIAAEFGAALSEEDYGELARDYLRTARNRLTMDDLAGNFEEHDHSEVLTGAFYDFLKGAYALRLAETLEARGKQEADGGVRVSALISAARLTSRMMFRALDYCPPVDVSYLDYARAVLRADAVAYPGGPNVYRELAEEVFLARRICGAATELRASERLRNSDLRALDVERLGASKTDAYAFVDLNRRALRIPATANLEVASVYRTHKVSADGYRPPQEIVVEFVWAEDVALEGVAFGALSGSKVPLWCGGTLVFNRDGNVIHYVLKEDTPARRAELAAYVAWLVERRYVGLDDGEVGLGARGRGANRVLGSVVDGRVHLRRTPAFRHAGRGGGRRSDG